MLSFVVDRVANNRNPVSVSSALRKKRFSRFLTQFSIDSQTTILDVGGTPHTWMGSGFEKNVVLLNLAPPAPGDASQPCTYVKGNALDMHMFEDKSFDVVFSNSVIEHVGSPQNQRRFAEEVQRVGKAFWVQTPSRYFPVEPHVLFPFFQFLPVHLQKQIAVRWKYSHYKKWGKCSDYILGEVMNTRLLNRRELTDIFGSACTIYEERLLGLIKSYVAYKKPPFRIQSVARRRRAEKVA